MAALGVIGYSDGPGGSSFDFNWNGTGGASAGDIYGSGLTTQQISKNEELKRTWGLDVVESGPHNSNETQAVRVQATGGTFTLSFGGETTPPLPYDSTAAAVESALNALPSIGGVGGAVNVTGGPGDLNGTSPYLVSFGGVQGGVDQPLIEPSDALLTGPSANAFTATTNPGGTGFEVCEPESGDICKSATEAFPDSFLAGGIGGENNVAVDQVSGDVYISNTRHGVNKYSANGDFLLSFGHDVVAIGPHDGNVDQKVRLQVKATGGTYTIGIFLSGFGTQTSGPIPYDAPPAEVAEKVNAITSMEENRILVTATGGPGNETGATPYILTFGGTRAGDEMQTVSTNSTGLLGSPKIATAQVIQAGGSPEVCTPSDACKQSVDNEGAAGSFRGGGPIAVAPPGSPNEGNILIGDTGFNVNVPGQRIVEYTPDGAFIRAFGGDTVATGPHDSAQDEQQTVTVKGTGGAYSLSYRGITSGAVGTGNLVSGSKVVTNLIVGTGNFESGGEPNGEFNVGEVITGTGIPAGTTITAVTPISLEMSANATSTGSNRALKGSDIPYNATPAEVKQSIEGISTISRVGGEVTVTGGPGDLTGSTPYTVTFTGPLSGDDLVPMTSDTTALSISSGTKAVTIGTATQGGEFEVCVPAEGDACKGGATERETIGFLDDQAISVNENTAGEIFVVDGTRTEATAGAGRVQKFTPAGGSDLTPSVIGQDQVQEVTVNAGSGTFRLALPTPEVQANGKFVTGSATLTNVKVFPETALLGIGQPLYGQNLIPDDTSIESFDGVGHTLTMSQPSTGGSNNNQTFWMNRLYATGDLPYNASAGEVETALNELEPFGSGCCSVTVSGGPGGPGGGTPYTITFDGGRYQYSDQLRLIGDDGSVALSGGTGPGADDVTTAVATHGGPRGTYYRRFVGTEGTGGDQPVGAAIDPGSGELFVAKHFPFGAATCPTGTRTHYEFRVQRFSADHTLDETSIPCATDPTGARINSVDEGGLAIDPNSGIVYMGSAGKIYAFGDAGSDPELALNSASGLTATGAVISGTINPQSPAPPAELPHLVEARYSVEYRKVGDSAWTPFSVNVPLGSGTNPIPFNVGVSTLRPKTEYEARVEVTKPYGFQSVSDITAPFTTPAARPEIETFSSSNLTAISADLNATINPLGADTTYHFEYGTSPDYGQQTAPVEIGGGTDPVTVQDHITGLSPTVHHFRVVAENSEGKSVSTDQSFTFYPESCPNRNVRQQTGSNGLPDCRAYELVSPRSAGTAVLHIGGPYSAYATNPSRFVFEAAVNAIPGPWNPENLLNDRYVTSRSSTGWTTQYISGEAHELFLGGQPFTEEQRTYGNRNLSEFLQWKTDFNDPDPLGAPYVKNSAGELAGRLPTNLSEVPGADLPKGLIGDARPSGDFSHYFFSSADRAFAPGGQTSQNGSVYDNEIPTGSVTIASKTPGGADIPREPGDVSEGYLQLPAVSVDGSHVLMLAPEAGLCGKGLCGSGVDACDPDTPDNFPDKCKLQPGHLYLRVGGALTYDVSAGQSVKFEGMTDDGSEVFMTTTKKLTADDHDSSADLFVWKEATDSLERLSTGASEPAGDTNACAATWIAGCGVAVVPKAPAGTIYSGTNPINSEPSDNAIASGSGAVYFYSPEQLVGSDGIPGRRNLYVSSSGTVHYVSTLDTDKPVARIQVTPSGRYGAFITNSQLTAYEVEAEDGVCSENFFGPTSGPQCAEMYRYDLQEDELVCVSCNQSGGPPSNDVEGSQNGIFITEDGRAFFSTDDPLIERDTNGATDVYEYVSSRPQLITSGAGQNDSNENPASPAGLVGVSNDGTDVYFATFDTLVEEDENGSFLKFYDARTNGGFARAAEVAPCAAADECHGTGTAEVVAPVVTSTSSLSVQGNAKKHKKKKHKKKHKKKKHKKKHKKKKHKKKHKKKKSGRHNRHKSRDRGSRKASKTQANIRRDAGGRRAR